MHSQELKEIIISAAVLALAFSIMMSGGIFRIQFSEIINNFFLALIAVSSAFIMHEMGHRFVAKAFGCHAEYKMWPQGLMLALVFSLFGFVFAAPGAVVIQSYSRQLTRTKYGIISAIGPVMNIALASIFLFLFYIMPLNVFYVGAYINSWIAIFNLIPFPPLDGYKIFSWNKIVWISLLIISGIIFFIS